MFSRSKNPWQRYHATLHGVVFDILLFRVFVVVAGGGNNVGTRQPAVEVDVPAALGTERLRGRGGRLAADRALLVRWLGGAGARWRLSWHSASRSESESLRRRAA